MGRSKTTEAPKEKKVKGNTLRSCGKAFKKNAMRKMIKRVKHFKKSKTIGYEVKGYTSTQDNTLKVFTERKDRKYTFNHRTDKGPSGIPFSSKKRKAVVPPVTPTETSVASV